MTFSTTIRQHRLRLNLTQAELAVRLDVDKQSVSNWECGRSSPWAKHQAEILQKLGEMQPTARARCRVIDRILESDV
jgi:transcriptional regulator with XRE-family HTH domain